jgi:signal transduction histidine kinase
LYNPFTAQKRIAELEKQLEQERRTSKELIANVSHEIRTPIAAIIGISENLVDGVTQYTPAKGKQILRLAEEMANLVSFLLDISKVESGASALLRNEINVGDWLEDVITPLQMFEPQKNLHFVIDAHSDLTAQFDADRLAQAVNNVVGNAIRHAVDNSEVVVTAYSSENDFIIDIFNQGEEIDINDSGKIFGRFETRAVGEGSLTTGGTGLGLSIANWVVKLHGGKITARNPLEAGYDKPGALFTITLPNH